MNVMLMIAVYDRSGHTMVLIGFSIVNMLLLIRHNNEGYKFSSSSTL